MSPRRIGDPRPNLLFAHLSLRFDVLTDPARCRATYFLAKPATKIAVLEASKERLRILRVLVDGKSVDFDIRNDRLTFEALGARRLAIEFIATASGARTGTGIVKRGGTLFTFTAGQRVHDLFPCDNRPSCAATATLSIRAPIGSVCVASGILRRSDARWHVYSVRTAVPLYALGFYVSRSAEVITAHGIDYVADASDRIMRRRRRQHLDSAWDTHAFLTDLLGPPHAGRPLRIIEVPIAFGGFETSQAPYLSRSEARKYSDGGEIVAHEVAHQWFGNGVRGRAFEDMWLWEGLAIYLALRAREVSQGRPAFARDLEYYRVSARHQLRGTGRHDHLDRGKYSTGDPKCTNELIYTLAPWIFLSLEAVIGRSASDRCLARFYQRYAGQPVSSSRFLAHARPAIRGHGRWLEAEWVRRSPSIREFDRCAERTQAALLHGGRRC